ncbi:MAG: sugar transporter substrate-binding protein, partial [Proteobacteria bacterium]|nr:sugar transporter substrate-binding protein [Pseudomonadota bacterium]
KIYSADVSTADIQEIVADGSPWVATVATNPAVVGAAAIRAAAKLVAGEQVDHNLIIKPTLLTQAELRSAGVTTIEELAVKVPAFNVSDVATAQWIPVVK